MTKQEKSRRDSWKALSWAVPVFGGMLLVATAIPAVQHVLGFIYALFLLFT